MSNSARLQPPVDTTLGSELRLRGPELRSVVKAMREFWRELRDIADLWEATEYSDDTHRDRWKAEHDAKVAELCDTIGELRIGGQ